MADKNMEAQISVEFEEATSRQSLNSGETINTLWSKVKRWLSDLKAVAFSGSYIDLSDRPTTATTDTDGLMSAEDKTKLDDADNTYALKSKYGDTTINVGRKEGTAVGNCSTAEGLDTVASGYYSHAEGQYTTANGNNSCHSEGQRTTASGIGSHAEGVSTNKVTDLITDFSWQSTTNDEIINAWKTQQFSIAHRNASHVEGLNNLSLGISSHAEGRNTVAVGNQSHTSGYYTKALHDNEAAYGKYNESNDDTLFSIGDGTADDARHNAFEITTTGGKIHDKDIATTDLIPTTLPANGGNADTVDGMHASDFMPINGDVKKYGTIRMNGSDGIRARHIDGNDTEADGALYLNWNSPNAPIYMNGGNTAIHSGNIGSQSVNYANSAGNADTVGEKSADDFAQIIELGWNETDTKNAVGQSGKITIYHCGNWTDFPAESPDGQGIVIAANYFGSGVVGTDSMWVVQFFISARTSVVYKRYINGTGVDSWKEISTTPIKSTDIFGVTDQYSNLLLWKVTDARKPILVTMNGFYTIPFLTSNSDYFYYYAGLINCATHEYIPNTAVSGTVYYIDG